jgi:cell division protein FtsB
MKMNLSNPDDLRWLFNNNRAIALLQKENAPLILSFFVHAFKEGKRIAYLNSEISPALSDFLFAANQQSEQYSGTPKYYLEQWTKDGFLRQYYEAKNEEAVFELTPAAEQAIRWITELNKSEFVGTESRLLQVFNMLKDLVIGVTEDKEKKLQELEKRKAEIEREIERLQHEGIDRYDPTKIRESFMLIEESAGKLLSDFKQIEENFRRLNSNAREEQIKNPVAKGKFLDQVFEARDLIMDSDQGKSFRSFWEFLMDQDRQEELESYIAEIFSVPELSQYKHSSLVPQLKISLVDAGDRVNKTTDHLVEQLRKFIELKVYLENRRITQIIKEIEESALAIKEGPPLENRFIELDDRPGVSLVMDRRPYDPPKNPDVDSEGLQEGIAETDTSALFEQLYVDPQAIRERIRMLLRGKDQITLKEITEEVPVERGLTEIVTYFSVASDLEKQNKSVIDPSNKETITYERDGHLEKVSVPKTTFLA